MKYVTSDGLAEAFKICPFSCQIVRDAIKAHQECGVVMAEYLDYQKQTNALCALCNCNDTIREADNGTDIR